MVKETEIGWLVQPEGVNVKEAYLWLQFKNMFVKDADFVFNGELFAQTEAQATRLEQAMLAIKYQSRVLPGQPRSTEEDLKPFTLASYYQKYGATWHYYSEDPDEVVKRMAKRCFLRCQYEKVIWALDVLLNSKSFGDDEQAKAQDEYAVKLKASILKYLETANLTEPWDKLARRGRKITNGQAVYKKIFGLEGNRILEAVCLGMSTKSAESLRGCLKAENGDLTAACGAMVVTIKKDFVSELCEPDKLTYNPDPSTRICQTALSWQERLVRDDMADKSWKQAFMTRLLPMSIVQLGRSNVITKKWFNSPKARPEDVDVRIGVEVEPGKWSSIRAELWIYLVWAATLCMKKGWAFTLSHDDRKILFKSDAIDMLMSIGQVSGECNDDLKVSLS